MICERDLNLPMIELMYFHPSNMGHRVSILTFILLELFSISPKSHSFQTSVDVYFLINLIYES